MAITSYIDISSVWPSCCFKAHLVRIALPLLWQDPEILEVIFPCHLVTYAKHGDCSARHATDHEASQASGDVVAMNYGDRPAR